MDTVIETRKLTKFYGKSRGILDVDLSVGQGEIFGFIGPNGAGKSTTIRTLLSLIHRTSGEAYVFGLDTETHRKEILARVGYLPGEVFYYDRMRAADLLEYSASFYKKDCSARIKELADSLELDLNKRIEDMSLGNKKKVGIIQGLLHSPELIILDEPTSGLDPLMQRRFFELIKAENERGATVLFSSHILSEVQRICSRVAIIREGKIVSVQRIEDLRKSSYKRVSFTAENPVDGFALDGASEIEVAGNHVSFLWHGDCNRLIYALASYRLTNADITEPDLEEIFLHYYKS